MTPTLFPLFLSAFLTVGLFVTRSDAVVTAPDPVQTLRNATDELQVIMFEKPSDPRPLAVRAKPVLVKYFDFALLTRKSVGPGWRQLTAEQQQRTTELLTELIVRNYCAHFDTVERFRLTCAVPVALAADRCELVSTIIYPRQSIAVAYRAEQRPDGWRFYDVIVEGVSLVANYRAQFTVLFQQGGAQAIIGALEKNLAANPLG